VLSALGGSPPSIAFRGWRVVAGAFITSMVGFGAVYSYGAFSGTLAATFHMSMTASSFIISLSTGTTFAVSALSGVLTERFGCRCLAMAGMLTIAVGLLLASVSTNAPEIYLGYGALVGLGTGLAYVPAFAAVQRWFVTWRGLASGIAASGIGVGTLLIHPMTEVLSAYGDWRAAFRTCAVMVAAAGVTGALFLSDSPEQWGKRPDDLSHPGLPNVSVAVISLRRTVSSSSFKLMYWGILFVSVPVALPYAYLAASAISEGFEVWQATALISLLGMGSIVGRLIIASTADRFGRRSMFLMCCVGLAISTVIWANAFGLALNGFAVSFGFFYGGFVALLPAFASFVAVTNSYSVPLEAVAVVAGLGCYLLLRVRPLLVEV
jgi:OFA family oxalate/formate antiporter-like MFS transporter